MIDDCNLMDLGSNGYKYTWRGQISHGDMRTYERLNRTIYNANWRTQFSDAQVNVLAQVDFSRGYL